MFCFDMSVRFQKTKEAIPRIISKQQSTSGIFGDLSISAAKAVEAPLILQFIKDILAVCTFAVEFDNLPTLSIALI